MEKLQMIIANPAGNITAFVLDHVERSSYAEVARRIFDMEDLAVEQVGFVLDDNTMEMSGLEFCGNATRSFGLLSAKRQQLQGEGCLTVRVSGASEPLTVQYDTESNYAKISVELPLWTMNFEELREKYSLTDSSYDWIQSGTLVVYEGIIHAVVPAMNAMDAGKGCDEPDFDFGGGPTRNDFKCWFLKMRDLINELFNPPAMGVVYCEDERARLSEEAEALGAEPGAMKPIVYVKDVDSIYFEGSCGSGTTAYAAAYSLGKPDGIYRYNVEQPSGTILATCVIQDGEISELSIESSVEFSEIMEIV